MAQAAYPQALHISGSSIEENAYEPWEEVERDPRGLLLMFEPPNPLSTYIMGMDATEGITGWTRASRTDGDDKTDNGAIEIYQVDALKQLCWTKGKNGQRLPDIDPVTQRQRWNYRDVQVAEYAAPVDAVELARIACLLGRIYCGTADDYCELIWEAWPGVGMLATQELLRHNYSNLWMWEYIDSAVESTNHPGWRSTETSQRLLWYRARRHIMHGGALIRSKFLVAEYGNAEVDLTKMRARAAYGYHDDRFMASNMCFWAGHKWAYEVDTDLAPVTESPVSDYQNYAPTLDEYESYGDWKARATEGWQD